MNSIEEEVLGVIKSGEVKMRPRWYFILRDVLGMIAIVIMLLIAVYLASFIIFVLHQNEAWFVPFFGLGGWFALFVTLPWLLVLLSAIFIILLAVLVKRYQFSYQWPFLYSLLGILFLTAAAAFLFVQTSFYSQLFSSSTAQGIPFLGLYYPGFGRLTARDIHRGTITAINEYGFQLQGLDGVVSNVIISTSTNLALGLQPGVGEMVVVFGTRSVTGTIYAFGMQEVK